MINKEIIDFVRKEKNKGTSVEMMRQELLSGGWQEVDIQEAFLAESKTVGAVNLEFISPVHKKVNLRSLLVIMVLLVLVGGGITYAYQKGFFQSSPETIVSDAFENARNAKSSSFDVTFSMYNENETTPDITPKKSSLTLKGSYIFSKDNEFAVNTHASLQFAHISLGGDLRYVNNKLHIFADNLGLLENSSFSGSFKERWFYVEKKNSGDIEKMVLPFSGTLGVSPKVFEALTSDQKERVLEMTDKASFITITKKFGVETIKDVSTNHFSFILDQESIVSYLDALEAYIQEIGKDDSYLSTFSTKGVKDKLTDMKNFVGEIWVGRKDQLPYKVSMSFTIEKVKSNGEKAYSTPITIVSIFSDWNNSVDIVEPDGSVSFKELSEQVRNSFQTGSITPTKEESEAGAKAFFGEEAVANAKKEGEDDSVISILKTIKYEMGYYHKESNTYQGACASERQVKYASYIKSKPLGFTYVCNDSPTKWVVSAKLNTGKWWCEDSTGHSGEIATTPKTESCL